MESQDIPFDFSPFSRSRTVCKGFINSPNILNNIRVHLALLDDFKVDEFLVVGQRVNNFDLAQLSCTIGWGRKPQFPTFEVKIHPFAVLM
jgi:hypothetical protein